MNKEDYSIIDSTSREAITNILDKNFIVEAGAGSGKTTALVKRMISMVESGIDVSSISCITFTKAAASEFYERFQNELSKRSHLFTTKKHRPGDLKYPTIESTILCAKALENIDLCFMGTIDSFVQKLMNEHPYEFGIPSNVSVINEDKENKFITDKYYDILNGDKDKELTKLVKKASIYCNVSQFVKGVKYFMHIRSYELNYDRLDNLDLCIESELKEQKDKVNKLYNYLCDFVNTHPGMKVADVFNDVKNSRKYMSKNWDKYLFRVTKGLGYLNKLSLNKKLADSNGFVLPEGMIEPTGTVKNYKVDNSLINDILIKINNIKAKVLFSAFDAVAKETAVDFKANGLATYYDFIVNMRESLKEDAKNGGHIIKYVQQKRKYYLLDEFQDTNPLQTEIFFYLTATNFTDDFTLTKPIKGSLFIVGDPKQSIYRFTGADVNVFKNTEEIFEKDENSEVLYLTKNFRSSHKLRKYFNETMPGLLNYPVDKTEYLDIPLDYKWELDDDASFHGIYRYNDEYAYRGGFDYSRLSNLINNLVDNEEYTIEAKDKDGNEILRKLTYDDFMVIVPNKGNLTKIMSSFSANKIPFFCEGSTMFEESDALNEIKTLFNFLVMPNNVQYLYLALLTKYIGLNETNIRQIYVDLGELSIFNNNEIKDEYLKERFNLLVKLYEETKYLSYSSKMLYLIENTRLYERYETTFMEFVYYAYELVRCACNDGTINTQEDAIDFLSHINSENKDYERCFNLSKDSIHGKVHLANLHKTKGLEAPVVILASPKPTKDNIVEYRVEREGSKSNCYVICIRGDSYNDKIVESNSYGNNHDKNDKVLDELESLRSEQRRLQYVAATRAKNALIVAKLTSEKEYKGYFDDLLDNSAFKDLTKLTLESRIDCDSTAEVTASSLYDESIENKVDCSESLEKSYRLKKPSDLSEDRIAPEIGGDEIIDDTKVHPVSYQFSNKDDLNRLDACLKGTLVHRMMELIINSKDKYTKEAIFNKLNTEFYISDENSWILDNIFEQIHNGGFKQVKGIQNDILDLLLNAKQVLCEVPFSYLDGTTLYHGVMDVVYQDNDENWHILDYKTNKEKNVAVLEEEYKSQLEGYIKSFKETTGLDADAHIYHIEL